LTTFQSATFRFGVFRVTFVLAVLLNCSSALCFAHEQAINFSRFLKQSCHLPKVECAASDNKNVVRSRCVFFQWLRAQIFWCEVGKYI